VAVEPQMTDAVRVISADQPPNSEELAGIWFSIMCEPGDEFGGYIRQALGVSRALHIVKAGNASELVRQLISEKTEDFGVARFGSLDKVSGDALARWLPRLSSSALNQSYDWLKRSKSWLITPQSELWPENLNHLGWAAPAVLWGRGSPRTLTATEKSLSVVGSRGATNYGSWVTGELISELKPFEITIVSGGAYGIDAAAHRTALAAGLPTVAVLAGGVDRLYPSGNHELFDDIMTNGAVVSELPPGSSPTKWRFLQRNRLIAALADATLVVEAGKRSGSISTANHASELGRPVGAIPGPITATSSHGCNRLIQSGQAELIQDGDDLLSLLGIHSRLSFSEIDSSDNLGPLEKRLIDALSTRPTDPSQVAKKSGLTMVEANVAFTQLSLLQLVESLNGGWARSDDSRNRGDRRSINN
jgi:DNA processing protein